MFNRISFLSNYSFVNLFIHRRFCHIKPEKLNRFDNEPGISRTECLKMLDHFRRRQPYKNHTYLRMATYFCWKTGLDQEFIDVADEWLRQARRQEFDHSYFKVTSNLCNLGKINRSCKGALVEKLGWPAVEYLMIRMSEIGFYRFHVEDIAGAVNGLSNLILLRGEKAETANSNERKLHPKFLKGLQRYLSEDRSNDDDYLLLIHNVAPQLLYLLSYTSNRPPTIDLLRSLCRLSKIGFDRLAAGDYAMIATTDDLNHVDGPHWYARSFLRWKLDPETILRDSWSSWYRASAVILKNESDRITFRFLSEISSVAKEFNRITEFWPLFDLWFRRVKETCGKAADLQPEPGTESVEGQVVNLVFSCGVLIVKFVGDRERFEKCRKSFRSLLPTFEKALLSRPVSEYAASDLCYWLTGIRSIRIGLKLSEYEPSPELYEFLREWCRLQRSEALKGKSATAAALFLHLFRDMKLTTTPPAALLNELVNLFSLGLNSIDKDVMKMISFFTTASAAFMIKIEDEWFWDDYFRKLHLILDESWRKKNERDSECAVFLSSIAHLIYRYTLFEKWRSIKDVYEKRTREMLDQFSPRQAFFLSERMAIGNTRYNIGFDTKIIDRLLLIADTGKKR